MPPEVTATVVGQAPPVPAVKSPAMTRLVNCPPLLGTMANGWVGSGLVTPTTEPLAATARWVPAFVVAALALVAGNRTASALPTTRAAILNFFKVPPLGKVVVVIRV